ncbi:EAL domain-containing protein [bacterium]|nr:EAL domain-containing protein [bacterium]
MGNNQVKVLVIEGGAETARLLQDWSGGSGEQKYLTEHASSLAQGLERLDEGGIGIAILSLSLPDSQGLEAFTWVRRQAPSVPIIVLAEDYDADLAAEVMAEGAQDFLVSRQLDGRLLSLVIRYAMERHQLLDELERQKAESLAKIEERLVKQNEVIMQLTSSETRARGDLDTRIREITEASARTLQVDRVSVWLYNDDRTKIRCFDLYEMDRDKHTSGYEMSREDYPAFFVSLEKRHTVAAPVTYAGPATKERSQSHISPLGIVSAGDADGGAAGGHAGVVCHEQVGSARRWTTQEQAFIGSVTELISLAFEESRRKQAEEQLRKLSGAVEHSPASIVIANTDGKIEYVNPKFTEVTGYTLEEVRGKPFILKSGKRPEEFYRRMWHDLKMGKTWRGELINKKKSGELFWEFTSISPIKGSRGVATHYVAVKEDVTERKRKDDYMRRAVVVFESTSEGIITMDADGTILDVNAAFSRITGYSKQEVVGETARILMSDRHSPQTYGKMWKDVKDSGHWWGEVWGRRKNNELFRVWMTIRAVKNDEGEITHYIGVLSDITKVKESEEERERLAHYDILTELPNRILLRERLQQALRQAERERGSVAVLFLNFDGFKNINARWGHQVGDEILVQAAKRLADCVGENDTVARSGGDEFVAVLSGVGSTEGSARIAQKMIDSATRPFPVGDEEAFLTASIGITMYPFDGDDVDSLLKNADVAMHQSRAQGENAYGFYSRGLYEKTVERMSLESDLRRAVDRGELLLHYQPQISLENGAIVGLEALVRWQHPQRGMVGPDQFIPMAEETGLIMPIGEWVLREACRQSKEWHQMGVPHKRISVNISGNQFKQQDVVQVVTRALVAASDPRYLCLELTESGIVQDPDLAIATLGQLKDLGLHLSIDDFGTGYSSLGYLKRFPVDELKVPQWFIREVLTDSGDAAIVAGTIVLARSLGLSVVVEGVENEGQFAFVRNKGANVVQGFLFSRPLPPDETEKFLLKGKLDLPGA